MKPLVANLPNNYPNYGAVKLSNTPVYTLFNMSIKTNKNVPVNLMVLADFVTFEVLGYKLSSNRLSSQEIIDILREHNIIKAGLYMSKRAPYTKKDLLKFYSECQIDPSFYTTDNQILQSMVLKEFMKKKLRYRDQEEMTQLLDSWSYKSYQILRDN
jgi:hypothetical protein